MNLDEQKTQSESGIVANQIKYQIDILKQEYTKPGWNLWIIMTAIAACMWLLIEETEKKLGQVDQIFFFILFLTFVEQFIASFPFRFKSNVKPVNKNRYYYSNFLFMESKRLILFYMFKYSAIATTVLYFNLFEKYFKIIMIVYFTFIIIGLICLLILSNCKIPMPVNSMRLNNKGSNIMFLGICILLVLFAYKVFLYIDFKAITLLTNIKYGVLVITILYLTPLLIKQTVKNPFIHSLEEVYRDLIFDVIEPESAKARADLIINGLNYKYYFQDEFIDIINSIHELDNSCIKVSKLIDSVNSINSDDIRSSNEKKLLYEALIDSINYNENNLCEIISSIEKKFDKLSFKFKLIDAMDRNNSVLLEIKNEIKTTISKAKEHASELSQKKVNYIELT